MRRLPPPRVPRAQLRRNRKQHVSNQVVPKHKRDWLNIFGSLASVVTSLIVAIALAGPENVRNIPNIPRVAHATLIDFIERKHLENNLSGTWVAKIPERPGVPAYKMTLEMTTSEGSSGGLMTTLASLPWSRSEYTDFQGQIKGEYLELEFWGFIFGERKIFAKSRIRITPEPCPTICEERTIDFSNLTVETYWQSIAILPKNLQIIKD